MYGGKHEMALEDKTGRVGRKCENFRQHLESNHIEGLWGYYVFTTYEMAEAPKQANTVEGDRHQTQKSDSGGQPKDADPQTSDSQASSTTLSRKEAKSERHVTFATDVSASLVAEDPTVEQLKNYLVAHINHWVPEPYDEELTNTLRFKHINLPGASFADIRQVLKQHIKDANEEWMKQPAVGGYGLDAHGAAFGSRTATCLVIDYEVAALLRAGPDPVLGLDADGYYDDQYEEIREQEKDLYVKVVDADYDDAAGWKEHFIAMSGRPGPNLKPEHCKIWPGWMKLNP